MSPVTLLDIRMTLDCFWGIVYFFGSFVFISSAFSYYHDVTSHVGMRSR